MVSPTTTWPPSEELGQHVVLLVSVGVQTFERLPFLVALPAEEEVVAVLAHPTVLQYHLLAVEAIVDPLFVEPGLHYHFEFVLAPVVFGVGGPVVQGALEEAFLT